MPKEQELARTAIAEELRRRREERLRQVLAGERPGRPAMSDEELGAEAVRLVKASRARRAQIRPAQDGQSSLFSKPSVTAE